MRKLKIELPLKWCGPRRGARRRRELDEWVQRGTKLHERGVLCLITTGQVPSFPLPDLALRCLMKPFGGADLVYALTEAEDVSP
jgi:hypothetical protein